MGEPVAIVLAKNRYLAEDAAARVEVAYDVLPAAADCREAARADAPKVRREFPSSVISNYRIASRSTPSAAHRMCCARNSLHSPRCGASGSKAAASSPTPQERWLAHGVASTRRHTTSSTRRASSASTTTTACGWRRRRRRRLRPKALRLCGGRRGHRRRKAVETLGHLDRGPPRAFPRRGPGARPVLGDGDRGRTGRPHPRHTWAAAPRPRRLCPAGREPAVQLGVDADRSLYGAGLRHGCRGHRHQQDAGLLGARRRLSAGLVHHGTPARSACARNRHRARGAARTQSHPGREDALPQAAQDAGGRNHRLRQRQLPRRSRNRTRRDRLGGISGPSGERPRRRSPDRHRARSCDEREPGGPFELACARFSDRAYSVYTGAAAMGQGLKTALAQICASEPGVPPRGGAGVLGDTSVVPVVLGVAPAARR